MRLFKDKVTEKLWVEMCEGGNLIDFAGHSYNGDIDELIEVNTDPNSKEFCRQHIVEEKFNIDTDQDWHLKDILFVPVEGKDVAFRVEHISKDKVYFVAVDAVDESTMLNMNKYLDDYLEKMPKALVNQMYEMEHGLKAEAERCKNLNGKAAWYWLDTPWGRSPRVDSSTNFINVDRHGWSGTSGGATGTLAVVPCFSVARKPKAGC